MFGLSDETRQRIITCLSGFEQVRKAAIFGSRATGTYRKGSDIDIVLWVTGDDPLIIGRITEALDELPTPYLFDVIDYHAIIHPPLKAHIDHYAKPLFA